MFLKKRLVYFIFVNDKITTILALFIKFTLNIKFNIRFAFINSSCSPKAKDIW